MSDDLLPSRQQVVNPTEAAPNPKKRSITRRVIAGVAGTALITGACLYRPDNNSGLKHRIKRDESALATLKKRSKRVIGILGRLNDVPPGVIDGSSLHSVRGLAGYGGKVKPSEEGKLGASTLELLVRSRNGNQAWQPDCTVTKVGDVKRNYILTAQHCFGQQEMVPSHGGPLPEAVNITHKGPFEYAVALPAGQDQFEKRWQPIAKIDNIAVDESGRADWALAEVDTSTSTSKYNNIPTLSLNSIATSDSNSAPGEPVAFFSLPEANGNRPVRTTGVYLGRYSLGGITDEVNLVGVVAEGPALDPCNYGASGSQAILADGSLTGPLSSRNTIGYGPYRAFIYPDKAAASQSYRFQAEEATGLDLDEFTTICGYAVPKDNFNGADGTKGTVLNLESVLAHPEVVINPMLMK